MYTIESFCKSIWGTSFSKVSQSVNKEEYKEFTIPKKNGTRTINYLPSDSQLVGVQRKLLNGFLEKQALPVCVKGFRKGESYKSYLLPHINSVYFFRTDLKDFFPSVSESKIKETLSDLIGCDSEADKNKLLDLITDIVTLNGTLPQGACTSPSISNLVMARLDQRILKYCQVLNIRYTRYADDLLFSSKSFDFQEKAWFIKKIKHILKANQFEINYSKNKYGTNQLSLNGYVLSKTGLRLSRNRLSDIRHVCSFVENNYLILNSLGKDAFLTKANQLKLKYRDLQQYPYQSVFQLSQYLCGYRAFLISLIDPYFSETPFQKSLCQLIRRIEKQVTRLL